MLQSAEWRLKWAGWSWVDIYVGWDELREGGWSWVEVGARFINTHYFSFYYSYDEVTIFYLHIPKYLMFLKQDRFILVKLAKAFTPNFQFYGNLGKLTRRCLTYCSLKFFPLVFDLDLTRTHFSDSFCLCIIIV